MSSDLDQVFVINDVPVATDPTFHPVRTCLLLVEDEITPPGSFKLQVVHNGKPLWGHTTRVTSTYSRYLPPRFRTDKNNRLVCSLDPSEHIRGVVPVTVTSLKH